MASRLISAPFETQQHIEVYKFYAGSLLAVTALALLLQAFLPVYFPRLHILDLPLLVTIYFGFSRRNPSTGLLLGMSIGLIQDSLGRSQIGLFGIAKTLVGFLASSLGARIDVEHPLSRFGLTAGFYLFHQVVYVLTRRWLVAQPEHFGRDLWIGAGANAVLAVIIFPLLDKLRLPS
jgi:rod shape-determining protein MreD